MDNIGGTFGLFGDVPVSAIEVLASSFRIRIFGDRRDGVS